MPSNYWSSTTNAGNTNNAWHVNFINGNDNNNKSSGYYVRAVRGGKCSLLSFSSLYAAYLDCRKRKRGTLNALRFEYRMLVNLFNLAQEIQQGTYQPSRSVCFVTTKPKTREIFAADFRDRIVHYLVVRELEKIYEPKFIYDSYASRDGKDTHAAVRRLQKFMFQASRNRKIPAWYLQLDIRSFFMSIDKNILFSLLERETAVLGEEERNGLLYLLHRIVFHDCTKDYVFKGDPQMLAKVPAHKSLFHIAADTGLPIGNLTSQFFANVYLNELDQFIKHRLKCRFCLRYVDDFILVSPDQGEILGWQARFEEFLAERLDLTIKQGAVLRGVSAGADFLGYIVRPDYLLARRRVVGNLKASLSASAARIVETFRFHGKEVTRVNVQSEAAMRLRQTLASYLGHLKHVDTYHLLQALWARFSWLNSLFLRNGYHLYDLYHYRGVFRTFRAQVGFLRYRLAGVPTLFRVGRYYELFGKNAQEVSELCGLQLLPEKRGIQYCTGFSSQRLNSFLAGMLSAGRKVAVIEQGDRRQYVQNRYVMELRTPGWLPSLATEAAGCLLQEKG